ncbi:MAG: murein biosynthesis integral membrane protein MurJ [Anaerolineae bacterium]|jgi:putative peptidoglycan lipid II flippase|nr:murein biosynthesis integral membrane protein MurJ [Anaerolineae bacterium]
MSSDTPNSSRPEAPRAEAGPPAPGLARSAGILGLGNIGSRVIGLLREAVISYFFGASGELAAFRLAARVPTMIYDLLVGGMLSAALVPVLTEYARPERRGELARVASAVLSLIAIVMGLLVLVVEVLAGPLANLLGNFEDPQLQLVLRNSLRVIAPAVLFFGLTGGATALLYALRRFSYTALSAAVFNLGIVLLTPLLAPRLPQHLAIYVLPLGIVLGSLLQLIVVWSGMRDVRLRPSAAWRHPAIARIGRLYVPLMLGLIVTQFQIIVDGRWASASGAQSVAWMGFATTLIQLPLGLIPVAVSLAALPSLSQFAANADWEGFRAICGRGLRLVLVLLLPATAGLFALALPIVQLIFQHGNFTPDDATMTALALRVYLIGLPFAGVDFLLNYTFYARQNTRTPAIVGVISIGFYFVTALLLKDRIGFLGLVLADSVKQAAHATIMTVLLQRSPGRLHGQRILRTLGFATLAAVLMAALAAILAGIITPLVPDAKLGYAIVVAVAGGVSGLFYILALRVFRVEEVTRLVAAVTGRLSGRNH